VVLVPKHRLIVTATDKSRIMETLPAPGINSSLDRTAIAYANVVNPQRKSFTINRL